MLKKVIITNVNSIGRCEINLEKGNYKFLNENTKEDIVNPLAMYGHNGSGKTSFFKAMDQLVRLMIDTPTLLNPFIVNDFKFKDLMQKKSNDENNIIGKIELFFTVSNNNYEYLIATSSRRYITEERLLVNRKEIISRSKEQYIFDRNKYDFAPNDFKLIPTLRQLAPIEINNIYIQEAFNFITSFAVIYTNMIFNPLSFVINQNLRNVNIFDLITAKSDEVQNIIKHYKDFPVYKIIKEKQLNANDPRPSSGYYVQYELKGSTKKLPIGFISTGMYYQSIILSIILTLPKNSVVFIDELENALHPSTIKNFLDFVRSRGIQLIFSSHNTNILQSLRPDQIYFAHWKDGVSKYSRLSNIYPNIREINNIEKMYLSSVFDEVIKKDE